MEARELASARCRRRRFPRPAGRRQDVSDRRAIPGLGSRGLPGEKLPEGQPHEGARDEKLPTEGHGQVGRDGL